jgi:hypothetical protein
MVDLKGKEEFDFGRMIGMEKGDKLDDSGDSEGVL